MSRYDRYANEPSVRLEEMGLKLTKVESPIDVTVSYDRRDDSLDRAVFVTTFFFSNGAVFGALVPICVYDSGEIMATVGLTGKLRSFLKHVSETAVLEDGRWINILKEKRNGKFVTTNFFDDLERALKEIAE